MIEAHLSEILEYLEAEYPKEGCGVIGKINGKTKWFPCRNQAEDPEEEDELHEPLHTP